MDVFLQVIAERNLLEDEKQTVVKQYEELLNKYTFQKDQQQTEQDQLQVAEQSERYKKLQTDKQKLDKEYSKLSHNYELVVENEDLWFGEIIKLGPILKTCATLFKTNYSTEVNIYTCSSIFLL